MTKCKKCIPDDKLVCKKCGKACYHVEKTLKVDSTRNDGFIWMVRGFGKSGLFKNISLKGFREKLANITIYPSFCDEDTEMVEGESDSDIWKSQSGFNKTVKNRFVTLAYCSWGKHGIKIIYDTVRKQHKKLFSPSFKKIVDEYRAETEYLHD